MGRGLKTELDSYGLYITPSSLSPVHLFSCRPPLRTLPLHLYHLSVSSPYTICPSLLSVHYPKVPTTCPHIPLLYLLYATPSSLTPVDLLSVHTACILSFCPYHLPNFSLYTTPLSLTSVHLLSIHYPSVPTTCPLPPCTLPIHPYCL